MDREWLQNPEALGIWGNLNLKWKTSITSKAPQLIESNLNTEVGRLGTYGPSITQGTQATDGWRLNHRINVQFVLYEISRKRIEVPNRPIFSILSKPLYLVTYSESLQLFRSDAAYENVPLCEFGEKIAAVTFSRALVASPPKFSANSLKWGCSQLGKTTF